MIDDDIRRVVPGRTFLDVGPLWVTENEKVSVAHHVGATETTVIDIFPEDNNLWSLLRDRLTRLNVPCTFMSADILRYDDRPFDVVYCAGVLYHMPEPLQLIRKLYQICTHHTILSTVIGNVAPGSCVFLPAVPPKQMEVLRRDWHEFLGGRTGGILSEDIPNLDINSSFPWW